MIQCAQVATKKRKHVDMFLVVMKKGGKSLNCTIYLLDNWMRTVGTNGPLRNCLTAYARKRGGVSMEHIVWDKGS